MWAPGWFVPPLPAARRQP